MSLGNYARVAVVLGGCLAAFGSASSTSNQQPAGPQGYGQPEGPPPPQSMDPGRSLGLWSSTFGAVKIEADNSKGGLAAGAVQGVWLYTRQGQEVVGYFSGSLRGNVLQFRWQEPANPPLTGEGYLVFNVEGRQYAGRWWSDRRDRVGAWNGWRHSGSQPSAPAQPQSEAPYGAQIGGGDGPPAGQQPAQQPPSQQPPSPSPQPPPGGYY
ncbi:MAG: hypothetical protein AB7O24_14725 [Kofleriaceae bacterium]